MSSSALPGVAYGVGGAAADIPVRRGKSDDKHAVTDDVKFEDDIAQIGKKDQNNKGMRCVHKNGMHIMKWFYNTDFGHPMPAELMHATTVVGRVKSDKQGRVKVWVEGWAKFQSKEFKGVPGGDNVMTCKFPAWGIEPLNVRLGQDNRG